MDNQLSINEKFLKKLEDILETNLEKEQFGVRQLADAMGLSRSQLHPKLKVITGKSTESMCNLNASKDSEWLVYALYDKNNQLSFGYC